MPFYQLHLMFVYSLVVLVDGSIAVTLACSRWPLPRQLINPKALPACGEDVDSHRGVLIGRECAAIVGELR